MAKKSVAKGKVSGNTGATNRSNYSISEQVKKSQLNVKNEFEYKKLTKKCEHFLDCSYAEEKESLTIDYWVGFEKPFVELANEKKELMVKTLIDAAKLIEDAQEYKFSINPDNLFYDIHGRVYVKARDIYADEETFSAEEFLKNYKALVGCTVNKKYKYEDYVHGGYDLLKEDAVLKKVLEADTIERISNILHTELEKNNQYLQRKYIKVDRKKYLKQRISLAVFVVAFLITVGFAGYYYMWERPYQKAVVAANEAYLVSDYISTVDAMKSVKVERMNVYQKYILAISCIRCESLSEDNMKNVLKAVNINSDERIMDYWIYLNRLNTKKAEDIAMQLSNDQLLMYAYLQEKAIVQKDEKLSGEEKTSRLKELDDKLKPLNDEYEKMNEEK